MNTNSEPAGWSRAELEALRAVALAALANKPHAEAWEQSPDYDRQVRHASPAYSVHVATASRREDAAHIAAFDPPTVIKLIEAIMALAPPSSLDGGGTMQKAIQTFLRNHDAATAALIKDGAPSSFGNDDADIAGLRAALAAAPLPVGEQGVMADRCTGTDTEAPTSPSSAGSVAGQENARLEAALAEAIRIKEVWKRLFSEAEEGFNTLSDEHDRVKKALGRMIVVASSAQAWIRTTVENAKAQNATIDIIATDSRGDAPFWTRTERVRKALTDGIRRAREAIGDSPTREEVVTSSGLPGPHDVTPACGVKLPPSDPTGSEDSQDAAPAGPTVGANTPSPPLADGEPETP